MSKKPDGVPYIEYYISMFLSYCLGPIDSFVNLKVNDKWVFDPTKDPSEVVVYSSNTTIVIDKPELFGGNLREGGLKGYAELMFGRGDQKSPQSLADRQEIPQTKDDPPVALPALTPDTMPGYRGIFSIFFHGGDINGAHGFTVGTQTPTVPKIAARLRNSTNFLESNFQIIVTPDGEWYNMNPAEMIACAMLHHDLMGGSITRLDLTSFNSAASLYNDEEFGLTLLWTGDSDIEDFVQNVLDHVNSLLFYNPFIGKMQLVPLRNDYEVDDLEEIGPDSCVVTDFRRPMLGETVNEIVLNWTNPETEESESITRQDLGMTSMAQGDVVSETRDFIGIRNVKLANMVLSRELRAAAEPLASCNVIINREKLRNPDGSHKLPGTVFKLTYPPHQVSRIVLRILEIDWGTIDDAKVTMKCVEDVFGLPYALYDDPPPTEWKPPGKDPDQMLIGIEYLFRATPYTQYSRYAPKIGDYNLDDDKYPQIAINTYVLPTNLQMDLQTYLPFRPNVDTEGNPIYKSIGERFPVGWSHMTVAQIDQEVESIITIEPTIGPGEWPLEGAVGMLVGEDEFSDELVVFKTYQGKDDAGNNKWKVRRGIWDTVPREIGWTPGTVLVIMTSSYDGYDWTPNFADTVEAYKFKVRTSLGLSGLSDTVNTARPDRPYRPYRPANCRINDQLFGEYDAAQDPNDTIELVWDDLHEPRDYVLNLTWSNRNRTAEDTHWLSWDDEDVPAEDGQTTEIVVETKGGTEITRIVGLTGTSYDFDIREHTGQFREVWIKFVSKRNDLYCLQAIRIGVKMYWKGYGSDFGAMWGGWPELAIMTQIADQEVFGYLGVADGTITVDS